jgi:transcriptional regulator with XRE-family HTH domain
VNELKAIRENMRLSILALSRDARVSRYRLWQAEQGEIALSLEERTRIRIALRAEAARLEGVFRALDSIADSAA